jgi:hypothetical protein
MQAGWLPFVRSAISDQLLNSCSDRLLRQNYSFADGATLDNPRRKQTLAISDWRCVVVCTIVKAALSDQVEVIVHVL